MSSGSQSQLAAVFLGPSLPIAQARSLLDATYLPPARCGDFYTLLDKGIRTAVLLDGVFHAERAVWQREILTALDNGIAVIGASSMGALRGAELAALGVIGHGTVFEWYRDGRIDGDDEVALRHAGEDDGYRALSTPMVNIRATLDAALADGVLEANEVRALIQEAKNTYYPERSWRRLLNGPACRGWAADRRARLERCFVEKAVDIKRADAISALRTVASQGVSAPKVFRPPTHDSWLRRRLYLAQWTHNGRRVTGSQLFGVLEDFPEIFAQHRTEVFRRWYLARWAQEQDVQCPPSWRVTYLQQQKPRQEVPNRPAWLRENGLSEAEYDLEQALDAQIAWMTTDGLSTLGMASEAAILQDWVERQGIAAPAGARTGPALVSWLLEQEPAQFGLAAAWDPRAAVIRHLQRTGQFSALLERCKP